MALTIAFRVGTLCGGVLGVLVGALVADSIHASRSRRRRRRIDLHGSDAVESWLVDIDWQRQAPTNGHPFGDETTIA